ncbi:Hypothetical_protein [Hexamita inflata]|uniref:Hypothetical_protein n=1 Tax=Hexamita inflata TaxID=28002 RepID=A0AA86PDM1_9EUKA|nr:Hypothetical protein HINF_LOCUS23168 [Hexamita inflata]
MVKQFPLTPSRNKPRLQPQYNPILWFLKLNHGEDTGCKRPKMETHINSLWGLQTTWSQSQLPTKSNKLSTKRLLCTKKCIQKQIPINANVHPNFFNKSGIVNFLIQDFGKTAKPLAKQITDNLKKNSMDTQNQTFQTRINFYSSANASQAPVITDLSSMSRNTQLYQEIDKQLMAGRNTPLKCIL